MWNRGINSDAVLRSAAKGEGRGGATRGSGGGSRGGRGGRGGVGSGAGGSYYQRGVVTGCQGQGDGDDQQPYGRQPRPRAFDRSQVMFSSSSYYYYSISSFFPFYHNLQYALQIYLFCFFLFL